VIAGIYLLVTLPIETYLTVGIIDVRVTQILREIAYPAAASALMGVAVVGVGMWLPTGSALIEFVVSVLVGVVAYSLLVLVLVRWSEWGIERNVETVADALRG
jgi:PST family polysaccharide transporter/lipopolysaccharide exporter